jgi:hypothetical protein
MFEDMGISAQIQSKANRPANAAQTMDRIIQGKGNEIGFGLIPRSGPTKQKACGWSDPLPVPVQTSHQLRSDCFVRSKLADDAKSFVRVLVTPAAKRAFAIHGSRIEDLKLDESCISKSKVEISNSCASPF